MRVPREWLESYVDLGDVSTETLVGRLAAVGLPVEAVEQVGDDTVLDVEVTSNRPDCLSIIGIAREAALLFGRLVGLPEGLETGARVRPAAASRARAAARPAPPRTRPDSRRSGETDARPRVSVAVEDPQGCPRFTATVIDEVHVGPSPAWMRHRLEAAGVRAINNVVDATNYVMLEMGQPMHAFDLDRVGGRRLTVRRARPGETLVTLDGVTRTLDEESLVVADATHAVSVAGIIGGHDTEIGERTSTVLLEAAHWHPPAIGRTSRRLGIRTEASSRFERGADPEGPALAQRRAALILAEIGGGHAAPGMVDVRARRRPRPAIRLRPARATAVLGIEVPRAEMVRALRALGCDVKTGAAALSVQPPTYRPDITREEDLIEEVIRVYGYDRVPLTLPRATTTPGGVSPGVASERRVRDALVRVGLSEVLTQTLVRPEEAAAGGGTAVRLANPLTIDQAALRTSLVPGLVRVLATNASRRQSDVHVFELGRVWRVPSAPVSRGANGAGRTARGERPEERRAAGIAVMGRWRWGWNVPADGVLADFYHLRAILDALLEDLDVSGYEVAASLQDSRGDGATSPGGGVAGWWHPGRVADVILDGRAVARFGELHSDVAERERLPHRACLAEVDLEVLLPAAGPVRMYRGLPRYPEIERDLAVVLPVTLAAAEIERLIRDAAGPLLEAVELFDVYEGSPVPAGHRNLAYRVRLRAADRTLTAVEAEEIMARIRTALQQAGGQLRA